MRLWLADEADFPHVPDRRGLAAETEARIDGWNRLGRGLCAAFVEVAERSAVAA